MNRPILTLRDENRVLDAVTEHLQKVLRRKGPHAFVSRHEALGVLEDERLELVQAIQQKHSDKNVRHELLDLAVAALWAVASIDSNSMDR